MNVWKVRGAEKTVVDPGSWQEGKMSRTAFPMSKSRSRAYRLGAGWRWRIMRFYASEHDFRLLVAFRTDKEQFIAMLGMDDGGDMKIVATLEFHGTHPGGTCTTH
jgi:hypothetical protein